MDCGNLFYCEDCKKVYYLGYEAYTAWADFSYSLAEFDSRNHCPTLLKNQNMRKCLKEHEGHNFNYVYHDYHDGYEFIDLYDHHLE